MGIRETAQRIFGKEPTETEEKAVEDMEAAIIEETQKMLREPRTCRPASYTNRKAPMSYEELQLLVPDEIIQKSNKKHRAVFGLLQSMVSHLEDARRVSKQVLVFNSGILEKAPVNVKIRAIQEQMSACRFRIEVNDFQNAVEEKILKNRLYDLYEQAKVIDPEGTSRYERYVDKQLRKRGRA